MPLSAGANIRRNCLINKLHDRMLASRSLHHHCSWVEPAVMTWAPICRCHWVWRLSQTMMCREWSDSSLARPSVWALGTAASCCDAWSSVSVIAFMSRRSCNVVSKDQMRSCDEYKDCLRSARGRTALHAMHSGCACRKEQLKEKVWKGESHLLSPEAGLAVCLRETSLCFPPFFWL